MSATIPDDLPVDSLGDEGSYFDPEHRPRVTPPPSPLLTSSFMLPSTGFLGAFLEQALLEDQRRRADAAEDRDTL